MYCISPNSYILTSLYWVVYILYSNTCTKKITSPTHLQGNWPWEECIQQLSEGLFVIHGLFSCHVASSLGPAEPRFRVDHKACGIDCLTWSIEGIQHQKIWSLVLCDRYQAPNCCLDIHTDTPTLGWWGENLLLIWRPPCFSCHFHLKCWQKSDILGAPIDPRIWNWSSWDAKKYPSK